MSADDLTPAQLDHMRGELCLAFPHLDVEVEVQDDTLYVAAVPT